MTSIPEKTRATDPVWVSPDGEAPEVAIPLAGWARIAWRLPIMALVVFGGLALHLLLRLFERPVFGLRRPVTPYVTQSVCKAVFAIMGIRIERSGTRMRERGAVVANHVSWLDIFALNAPQRVYFVSKSEVASWPGIGWLARATGTVFIRREARDARLQREIFEARLRAGHHLCFFPEGTNTDGLRVLPFKPTLFAAFFAPELRDLLHIQPVALVYHAPQERDARFYGWWGELGFGAHLLRVLAQKSGRGKGRIEIVFLPSVAVADFPDRKALARHCGAQIREVLKERLPVGVYRDE